MYQTWRLFATGSITGLGLYASLNDHKWPDQSVKLLQKMFTAYILSDSVALTFMGKMTPSMIAHHTLFTCSALSSFEVFSGDDSVAISNCYPYSCACESMAFLACLDKFTNHKYDFVFHILHILNIIFLRRYLFSEIKNKKVNDIKSDKFRKIIKTIAELVLYLDMYWFAEIVLKLYKPAIKCT